MKYRAEIDGLRALAIIPVILFHAGFELFSGGYVGVDVFFVISGYLITSILIEDLNKKRFSIINFYEKRVRRIFPALYVVVLTSIVLSFFILTPKDMKDLAQSVISTLTFSSNILFWLESGYFERASEFKPLLHTWSLAVEEQFYVFLPIMMWLLWKFGLNTIIIAVSSIFCISLLSSEYYLYRYPESAFYFLNFRAWELLSGSILALTMSMYSIRKSANLSLVGLFGIIIPIFFYSNKTPFPGFNALLPVMGTVLVILFFDKKAIFTRFLIFKPILGIGLISYSLYLWHQPIFAFYRIRYGLEQSPTTLAILTLFVIMLSYLSWKYIESPFRDQKKISTKKLWIISFTVGFMMIIWGISGHITDGFKNYLGTDHQWEILDKAESSPMRNKCHTRANNKTKGTGYLSPKTACTYQGEIIELAVFGNSHGVELAWGLSEKLKTYNKGLLHLTYSGCGPNYALDVNERNLEEIGCSLWTNEAIDFLLENEKIKTVVISYSTDEFRYDVEELTEIGNQRLKSYIKIIEALNSKGKQVVVVLQAPRLPRDVEIMVLSQPESDDVPGISLKKWREDSKGIYQAVTNLSDGILIVDPADSFCDHNWCYAVKDGKAMYFDTGHMSVEGAKILGAEIEKILN